MILSSLLALVFPKGRLSGNFGNSGNVPDAAQAARALAIHGARMRGLKARERTRQLHDQLRKELGW